MHQNQTKEATDFVRALQDDKCDPELGGQVRAHLVSLNLETGSPENYRPQLAAETLKECVREAFEDLGMWSDDPSTKDTPRRFAAMFVGELTKGLNYDFFPKCTVQPNGRLHDPQSGLRIGGYDQMVRTEKLLTLSLCEHHLQTIDGYTWIGYIPNEKVLGLSKFARVTDFFARRPQIQERMTEQIYHALSFILDTENIAVVQKATHFCMRARGAMQAQATTTTNKMGGLFMTNGDLRREFFDGIHD